MRGYKGLERGTYAEGYRSSRNPPYCHSCQPTLNHPNPAPSSSISSFPSCTTQAYLPRLSTQKRTKTKAGWKRRRTYPIPPIKNPRKPPRPLLKRLDVHDLDEQHVAGFRGFHVKRPRQVMHPRKVDILNVVGGIAVLDLPARPVEALDLDGLVVFYGCC